VASICPLLGEILHFPLLPVKGKAWYTASGSFVSDAWKHSAE